MSEFRRRLMMVQSSGGGDTYDSEVEYLYSDGNQYIELPVYPSEVTDACQVIIRRTSNTAQQRLFFSGAVFNVYANANNRVGFSYGGSWKAATNTSRSLIGTYYHLIKINYYSKSGAVDSLSFTSSFSGSSTNVGESYLNLFGKYGDNPTFAGRIYGVKFWRSGTLLYDLVPVRKNNVGYFYDKIGRKLYENKGTGSFTIGYDKYKSLSDYTQLDYIQSNSTAFINTGVKATGSTSIHVGLKCDTFTGTRYLFGAHLDTGNNFVVGVSSSEFGYYRGSFTFVDSGVAYDDTTYHEIEFNPTSFVIDDTIISLSSATINSQQPILLFNVQQQNTTNNYAASNAFIGKIYYAKIYNGETLVRDFVPVLHPDNVYGFFEKVENRFYPSANSADFSGGND